MTIKEQKLKADLAEYIESWAENNDMDTYLHETYAEDMADAAFAVFMAMKKKEQFLLDEGYHKSTV